MLVLHSKGDEAASPSASATAFELLGSENKEIHWYEKRSNHLLLWDYDADDVARRVVEFLDRPESD